MRVKILSLMLLLMAAGCGGTGGADSQADKVNADQAKARTDNSAEARRETVFDPMLSTIDRAESVGDISNSRMDELNKQLEESE